MLSKDDFDPELDGKRGANYVQWREGIYVFEEWPVRSESGRSLGAFKLKQVWLPTRSAPLALNPMLIKLDLYRADDDFDPA